AREALAGAGFHVHGSKVSQEREMQPGVPTLSGTWIMRRRTSRNRTRHEQHQAVIFCQCFVRCVLRVRVFMTVDASHEGTAPQSEPVSDGAPPCSWLLHRLAYKATLERMRT